jgi:hypothetical protein
MPTNDQGDYVFSAVRPATYTLLVEFRGFKTAVRDNVILQVAEKISINFSLAPGDIAQRIEVSGEAPLLQPASSSLGSVHPCAIDHSTSIGREECLRVSSTCSRHYRLI